MAARYWIGNTGQWNSTNTANWSDVSGGAGGASVPTSEDDVYIDANSFTTTVQAIQVVGTVNCRNFDASGATTISATLGGTVSPYGTINVYGSFTLSSLFGMNATSGPDLVFRSSSAETINTAGRNIKGVTFNGTGSWTLLAAINTANTSISVLSGTFNTGNYSLTCLGFSTSGTVTRAINFGTSTVTVTGGIFSISSTTNLTIDATLAKITFSTTYTSTFTFNGAGLTYDRLTTPSTGTYTSIAINGANTFNELRCYKPTAAGIFTIVLSANQIIGTTQFFSGSADTASRIFLRSNTLGTTRTITLTSLGSSRDTDFRDITIAGSAAPISGTNFGDCKGNSGITFGAPKTVYWNLAAGGNWSAAGWALTSGGTPSLSNFPLAQDTAIFESTGLDSGASITMNFAYNIGTIDMSARTANTMTLAVGTQSLAIHGNWINGTGTTITATAGNLTFLGRIAQTLTSAGKSFPQLLIISSPGGSLTLQDNFTFSYAGASAALQITWGTFDANNYNVTFSGSASGVSSSGSSTRTIAIGSGTWTLVGGTAWAVSGSNVTVTGTGIISLTGSTAKTFAGGGIQTYPTINQGGIGQLTITGSNKFTNITNTAIGSVLFSGGSTNEFTNFNLNGAAGTLLTLGSTNTTPATLKKSDTWYMGANSTNVSNNTGLTFTNGGGVDYLSVSYISGILTAIYAVFSGGISTSGGFLIS